MVEAQSAGVSTGALAQAAGIHENTVRGHLDRLVADGYIIRERGSAVGRGRPAWLWRAVSRDADSPYAALASVLADTLARTSDDPVADAREAGRAWGREIAGAQGMTRDGTETTGADAASGRHAVIAVMRDQGFAPHDTGDDIVLRRCPLIEAAAKHPTIVCSVHLGMIDGVLETIGRDDDADLVPFTGPGECTLRVGAAS